MQIFPQAFVENQMEPKEEWILVLHSSGGQKQNCKMNANVALYLYDV